MILMKNFQAEIILLCILIPNSKADTGDEFSNNLFSDLAPLLALFGEQVTKQFLSQSLNWVEHIIFACGPLGIITAVVSAIRVGGSKQFKAGIGRARETQAEAELELMSSTSADVCELWNGEGIVRVAGSPNITEILYNPEMMEPDVTTRSDAMTKKNCDESPENAPTEGEEGLLDPRRDFVPHAPNISLNTAGRAISPWKLKLTAVVGVILQASVLVFDAVVTYHLNWEKGGKKIAPYGFPLTLIGTLFIVFGMYLCAYVIEISTDEKTWVYKDISKQWQIVWLQKGQIVNDQKFRAYAIYASKGQTEIITSKRSNRKNLDELTTLAAVLTIIGFVLQFVGLRSMHFSASIAQLVITSIMTALRILIRSHLSRLPMETDDSSKLATDNYSVVQLPEKHELASMSKRMSSCSKWSVVIRAPTPFEGNAQLPSIIVKNRLLLGKIAGKDWQGELYSKASSISETMESVMNYMWTIDDLLRPDQKSLEAFSWKLYVTAQKKGSEIEHQAMFALTAERSESDGKWMPWVVDRQKIESVLSLWTHDLDGQSDVSEDGYNLWIVDSDDDHMGEILTDWWIAREKPPVSFANMEQACQDMSPNRILCPAANDLTDRNSGNNQPGNSADSKKIHGITEKTSLETMCCQFILYTFMSAVVCSIDRLKGPVTFAHRIQGQPVQLVHETITKLADIFQRSSMVSLDFSYMLVVVALHVNQKLPSLENLVFQEIIRCSKNAGEDLNTKIHCRLKYLSQQRHRDLFDRYSLGEAGKFAVDLGSTYQQCFGKNHRDTLNFRLAMKESVTEILGIKINFENDLKYTSKVGGLYHAILGGQIDLVFQILYNLETFEEILQTVEATINEFQMKPLELAIRTKQINIIKLFLYYGAGINGALDRAIYFFEEESSYTEIVKILVCSGVDMKSAGSTLHFSIENGFESLVKFLLEKGADANVLKLHANDSGYTALDSASKSGQEEIVIMLLEYGADLNSVEGGNTSLFLAVQEELENMVELLLHKGADPCVVGIYGHNALLEASSMGRSAMLRLLLEYGTNPKEVERGTAVNIARYFGHETLINLLLEKGADINATDSDGNTLLHITVMERRETSVRALIDAGANIDAENNDGKTPLHMSIGHGENSVLILKLLIENGADINATDSNGATILHRALSDGSLSISKLLLENGADIESADKKGRTALENAVIGGHDTVVRFLLDNGADVHATNGKKQGVFHFLTHGDGGVGADTIVQLLLDKGAEINARDYWGEMPLHKSASEGNQAVTRLLLAKGADVHAVIGIECTALHISAEKGHEFIVEILIENGANIEATMMNKQTALLIAAEYCKERAVTILIDNGANIDARDRRGNSALHSVTWRRASFGEAEPVVRLLIEKGADIEARNAWGYTALHLAALNGGVSEPIMRLLIQLGADVNAVTKDKTTVLQIAVTSDHADPEAITECLLRSGAQINQVGRNGTTALHCVVVLKRLELTQILLHWGADMDIKDNDGNTALQLAMHRKNNSNLVQMMIRHRQNREPAAHVKREPRFLEGIMHEGTPPEAVIAHNDPVEGVRGPEEVQGPAE